MTDLADSVPSLQRMVAPPGAFSTVFPDATDDDLTGALMDAFGEAQLTGFFNSPAFVLNVDTGVVTPDLNQGMLALVVIYAGIRIIRAELLNRKTAVHYEASGAIFDQQQAATVLSQILKDLAAQKEEIYQRMLTLGAGIAFTMADAYYISAVETYRYWYPPQLGYVADPYGW